MNTRKCEFCGKEFSAQRNDAKFCSSSCRSLFWKRNKTEVDNEKKFQRQLKGVVDDNPFPVKKTITEMMPNQEFVKMKAKLKEMEDDVKRCQEQKLTFTKQLQSLKNPESGGITLLGAGAGAAIGYNTRDDNDDPDDRLIKTIIGAVLGLLGGAALESLTKEELEKQRQASIKKVSLSIDIVNNTLTLLGIEIAKLKTLMNNTKQFLAVEKEVMEKPPVKQSIPDEKPATINENKHQPNVNKQLTDLVATTSTVNPDSKIISSIDLEKMEYKALNFQGRWNEFFGLPSVNFHCAVYGMSGEGKSTFSIQFANYLAENFGLVIYVSSEEGFAKTMKDKFVNNNAASPNLFLTDVRTYEALLNEVKPNIYNFIIIDSLDNMRIGAQKMKDLRKLFINSVLVTISQSTKEGKMRGSYEIVHDSDIGVSVKNGIAKTVKNRFVEKGRFFEIFEKGKDPESGFMPRNTVKG